MKKGEVVDRDSFDSNCITPGTPFMARLGAHLRFFVRRKIAEDPAWQRPHVIFSGDSQIPMLIFHVEVCRMSSGAHNEVQLVVGVRIHHNCKT